MAMTVRRRCWNRVGMTRVGYLERVAMVLIPLKADSSAQRVIKGSNSVWSDSKIREQRKI